MEDIDHAITGPFWLWRPKYGGPITEGTADIMNGNVPADI
jgi:hypothetical protein